MDDKLTATIWRLINAVRKVHPRVRENKHGDRECVFCGAEEYWDENGYVVDDGYWDLDHEADCPLMVATVLEGALYRASHDITQPPLTDQLEACLE